MVSIIKNLPSRPTKDAAKQIIGAHTDELYSLFDEHFGLDGREDKPWFWLSFPPGEFPQSKAGVVRNATAFEKAPAGSTPWAFALSDDPAHERTPWCLWVLRPSPGSVAGQSRPRKGRGHIRVNVKPPEGQA
jgi:hypothetical protein